jgi:LysM repeat protein
MTVVSPTAMMLPQGVNPAMMVPQGATAAYPSAMTLPLAAAAPAAGAQPAAPAADAAQLQQMQAAQAQATLGQAAVQPPSTMGTIVKNLLGTAAVGAAAGAGIGFLPFVPGGPITGALVGAGLGAVLGIVRGIRKARAAQEQANAMMMGSNNPAADPNALGPQIPVNAAKPTTAAAAVKPSVKKPKIVRVRIHQGDTLASIAKKHHTTVKAIVEANHKRLGKNPHFIMTGWHLLVPCNM